MTVAKDIENTFIDGTDPPVFIFSSENFKNLQAYLYAANSLPSTTPEFEARFNQDDFNVYFPKDKSLYKELENHLTLIQTNCSSFRKDIIPSMLELAASMVEFASNADKRYEKIREYLDIICADGAKLSNPPVATAARSARRELTKLSTRAGQMKEDCHKMATSLTDFHSVTTKDKKNLDSVHDRFVEVIPDGRDVAAAMDLIIQRSLASCNALKKSWMEKKSQLDEETKYMPTWLAAAFAPKDELGRPMVTPWHTEKVTEDRKKAYDEALAEHEKFTKVLSHSLEQVKLLTIALGTITDTIQGALRSVEKMTTVFTNMVPRFQKVKTLLSETEDGTHNEILDDRRDDVWDEFDEAPKVWKQISKIAQDFSLNGKIFDSGKETK